VAGLEFTAPSDAPVLGTDPDAIDLCEDRERFNKLCEELDIRQPRGALAYSASEAKDKVEEIGFP